MGLVRLLDITIEFTDEDFADTARFVYSHALMGEGICRICSPWLGKETIGDGEPGDVSSDGVPVPKLHNNCRCYLMPIEAALAATKGPGVQDEAVDWLESLGTRRLAKVVGPVRARLVAEGVVGVRELFHQGMLLRMDEMGFDALGRPITKDGKLDLKRKRAQFRRDEIERRYTETFG